MSPLLSSPPKHSAAPPFSSPFARSVCHQDVSLINPDFVWAQTAEENGGSHPPPPPENEVGRPFPRLSGTNGLRFTDETAAVTPEASRPRKRCPDDAERSRSRSRRVSAGQTGPGRFRFLDRILKACHLDQVDFHSTSAHYRSPGIFEWEDVVADVFFLQQLQSPLLYGPTPLDFSQSPRAPAVVKSRPVYQAARPRILLHVSVNFRDVQGPDHLARRVRSRHGDGKSSLAIKRERRPPPKRSRRRG